MFLLARCEVNWRREPAVIYLDSKIEGARRHIQNTRRMDSAHSGSICRRFINGSCRLGPRCHYRHELTTIPSAQICRYFQKDGCWYGERCRYLHVLQPEAGAAAAGRRSSVPTVSSSSVAYALPNRRRGSEPALLQAELMSRRSEFVVNVSHHQHSVGHHAADIAEEQSQDTDSHVPPSWESTGSSEVAQSRDGRNEQQTSSNEMTNGGAAAASNTQGKVDDMEAFLQSKNVTCGICMDKVYEKADPRRRVFGILPSCNHSFCLECIMTWRKTKDLGLDAVKSCPQCRVRSAFYVPNKYWVEGQAKESIIAAFKEKFSKKSCSYYARYRCCPFKSECLYRHDKREHHGSFQRFPTEEIDDYGGVDLVSLLIAMTLLSDDDDSDDEDEDFDFRFLLSGDYGF
ncbi:makorin, ring finger protein, 4 [Acanthopagrus schlegelii]